MSMTLNKKEMEQLSSFIYSENVGFSSTWENLTLLISDPMVDNLNCSTWWVLESPWRWASEQACDALSWPGELKWEDSSTVDGTILRVHKKEKFSYAQTFMSLLILAVGADQPAPSSLGHCDCPTVLNYCFQLWAQTESFSIKLLLSGYCYHSNRKID